MVLFCNLTTSIIQGRLRFRVLLRIPLSARLSSVKVFMGQTRGIQFPEDKLLHIQARETYRFFLDTPA
jgi:hypothetical protein